MYFSATVIAAIVSATLVSAFTPGFPYSTSKVRGVNLGGWLVLEPWITPSLFDNTGNSAIVDEWTFGQLQDKTTATNALKKHWDTWITESDFAAIAAAGLNHVRIPIGYWAWDVSGGEPFIQGQLPYLTKAVGWATNHGIKVIVDLHGAPGSQNGFDNSGQKMANPLWHSKQSNLDRTNAIIKKIRVMFENNVANVPVIAGLNEPAGYKSGALLDTARQYWNDCYGNIRWNTAGQQTNLLSLIHDAFQPLSYWSGFQSVDNGFQGVAMDTHIYQMFSDAGNHMSDSAHISDICNRAGSLSSFHLWLIVGEWTPSGNDCAKYLNGRGVGSRYDGSFPGSSRVGSCSGLTGKASGFSSAYKTFLGKMWQAQVTTYEKANGWIQWTWKAEIADEWSYQAGLNNGWIPQNPTQRLYPASQVCG